jgi:hypothetical protein
MACALHGPTSEEGKSQQDRAKEIQASHVDPAGVGV